ncbi:MAG: SMP-30/gluconolactonase/LRE family protein [Tidjanibacter sp.]|nr:SMP-30/gluconolactonase/LRE family protein [Tidjanibacter sp.]MBQ5930881.1 SMP-30/gluconolactonase/LRE family protein [Tidjanibacter sp.]
MKRLFSILCTLCAMFFVGCNTPTNNDGDEQPVLCDEGVFVLCEGSYGSGTASLWFYEPDTKEVKADVFGQANDAMLGDVGQSLYLYNSMLYVVVNNSGVVYGLSSSTAKVEGVIENLLSPRYIAISGDSRKGYISQMYTNKLTVFNSATLEVTGEVELSGVADGDQMAVVGDRLFVAAWSNGHKIVVIDTNTDKQIATIEVGVQPYSIALDKNNTLWIVCDGGNEWSSLPEGVTMEAPSLWKLNTESLEAQKVHEFAQGSYFSSHLATNGTADTLYFINGSVWAFDVSSDTFPTTPLIELSGWSYYGLGVDPNNGDIYIADAKDYMSDGAVLRYSASGEKLDEFAVGICPSKFAFHGE